MALTFHAARWRKPSAAGRQTANIVDISIRLYYVDSCTDDKARRCHLARRVTHMSRGQRWSRREPDEKWRLCPSLSIKPTRAAGRYTALGNLLCPEGDADMSGNFLTTTASSRLRQMWPLALLLLATAAGIHGCGRPGRRSGCKAAVCAAGVKILSSAVCFRKAVAGQSPQRRGLSLLAFSFIHGVFRTPWVRLARS